MNKPAIDIKNLCKAYRTASEKLIIFENCSFEILEDKIYALYGASGSGKSTLLHLLSGLDKPDEGQILIKETEMQRFSEDEAAIFRRNNMGFIFQFHHLLVDFTAVENIIIPILLMEQNLKKCRDKAEYLLEMVGLSNRNDHKPAELSGGERQRVAIARALANDPTIVFADEPTGNLDLYHSEKILELIQSLNHQLKTTFLIATHDRDISRIADFRLDIKDYKIKESVN